MSHEMSHTEDEFAPPVPSKPAEDPSPVGGAVNGHPANAVDQTSIVDLIKQEFDELQSITHVFIPVPGYERIRMTIKYHLPENGKVLDRIVKDVEREFKKVWDRNVYTGIDTMIELCEGIYVQPIGVDEPVKLDPGNTGEAVNFGEVAEALGWKDIVESRSARQAVRRLFEAGGKVNEQAILYHSEKLNRWLSNTKADLSKEFWQTGE